MSEDTPKPTDFEDGNPRHDLENADPTVQISNAELAAIRQSASQPEFTPDLLAEMDRQREMDAARQREQTPQYVHTSIAQDAADPDKDPTRSFDRERINNMLRGHRPPTERNESVDPAEPETDIANTAIADAVLAQSMAQLNEAESDADIDVDIDIRVDAEKDADVVLATDSEDDPLDDESLELFDDGMLHDIVFGNTDDERVDPTAPEAPAPSIRDKAPSEPAELQTPSPPPEEPAEIKSEDEPAETKDEDELMPRKSHPLTIVFGVLGLAALCAAILGFVLPDAPYVLGSVFFNALLMAAGALTIYISVLLRS